MKDNPLDTIEISWHIQDLKYLKKDRKIKGRLTNNDYREILQKVKSEHDASIGINWEVLEYHMVSYIEENKKS